MVHAVVEEAAALAFFALVLGMLSIWAQLITAISHIPAAWG